MSVGSGRLPIHPGEDPAARKIIHTPETGELARPFVQPSVSKSANIEHYREIVHGYVDEVLSGELLTGVLEQAACQRYLADLESDRGFFLDDNLAARAIDQFARLKHTQGEYYGKPFELHPIQMFTVWQLFGFVWEETWLRRFTQLFYSVARGNGKTPLGAGIMLLTTGYDVPLMKRATSYCAATTSKQARLGFSDISAFIRSSAIGDYWHPMKDIIKIPEHDSSIEPLPAMGGATSGLRIYTLLKDELHAFKEQHREYYNELLTGLGKFPQSLDVTITTAGDEDSVIWHEEHEHAKLVVSRGNQYEDDTLLAVICEIDDKDEEVAENLPKANPLMRHGIVDQDFLEREVKKANTPQAKAKLRRYRFNKRTESTRKAITDEMWAAGGGELPDLDGIIPCFGVDLGVVDDLSGIGYCFELPMIGEDRRFAVEVDVFAPPTTSMPIHKEPFATWIEDGFVTLTDKQYTDVNAMYASIGVRKTRHGIQSGNCDGYAAFIFAQHIQEEYGVETEAFKQSMENYCEPLRQFKISLGSGNLLHGDNPVLEWAAKNVAEKSDEFDRAMPTKKRSSGKIDPFIAVLMAFARCLLSEPEDDSYDQVAEYD